MQLQLQMLAQNPSLMLQNPAAYMAGMQGADLNALMQMMGLPPVSSQAAPSTSQPAPKTTTTAGSAKPKTTPAGGSKGRKKQQAPPAPAPQPEDPMQALLAAQGGDMAALFGAANPFLPQAGAAPSQAELNEQLRLLAQMSGIPPSMLGLTSPTPAATSAAPAPVVSTPAATSSAAPASSANDQAMAQLSALMAGGLGGMDMNMLAALSPDMLAQLSQLSALI